jgi:hypothetical protein
MTREMTPEETAVVRRAMRKARKCEVGSGHEYHNAVRVVAVHDGLSHCVCAGCGKMWQEHGDRFKKGEE